jgi:hypothetical protein
MKKIIATLLLTFWPGVLLAQGPMFRGLNYSAATPHVQVYSDNFAYTNGADLQTAAPTTWQYSTSQTANPVGFQIKVFSGISHVYAWSETNCCYHPASAEYIGPGTINADQYSKVAYGAITSVSLGAAVRINGGSWYDAQCDTGSGGRCSVNKVSNYVTTFAIATCPNTATAPTIELDAVGTSPTKLALLVNGIICARYTDSTSPITSGGVGISNVYGASNSDATFITSASGGNL